MPLGLPVLLDSFFPKFEHGIDDLFSLVATFRLSGGAQDEVMREVVRVLEGELYLCVWFYAKRADIILHRRLQG